VGAVRGSDLGPSVSFPALVHGVPFGTMRAHFQLMIQDLLKEPWSKYSNAMSGHGFL